MVRIRRSLCAYLATLAIGASACSGGGGSGARPIPLPTTSSSSTAPTSAKTASVAFTMHWTGASTASARHRNYVPATAQSVTVSVNGGQTQYLNNPATTLTIAAPPGVDNFAFATYDEQNGQGNVLSSATVTQTVLAGTGNFVSATLNAVIASIGVSLGNAALPAGTAATTPVNVTALDADGNVIVGPGDYDTPIHLAVTDPSKSGTLTLSTNLVQTPGTPAAITLSYTGGTLASGLPGAPLATIVASASGMSPASVAFTPTPTVYDLGQITDYYGGDVGGITAGPDGNMWVTDTYNDAIDKVSPAGVTLATYSLGHPQYEPTSIISASDGNLWFTESNEGGSKASGFIGNVTPSGALTEYNTVGQFPTALVDGGDGAIYYVDNETGIGRQYIGQSSATLKETKDAQAGLGLQTGAICVGGPTHALYFTDSGAIGEFALGNFGNSPSDLFPGTGQIAGVVLGPDGNIWTTNDNPSEIDVVSPATFTIINRFPTLTQGEPGQIVVGQDGALWFANSGVKLSRVTTSGTMTDFPASGAQSIAVAQDGSIWFGYRNSGALQKLVY